MKLPILSASRYTNYDLEFFLWEHTSTTKIERDTGAARTHNWNVMSWTHALTGKQVDALKDQNPRINAEPSSEISKIMQHDIHDDRRTNDSIAATTIILFRTSMLRQIWWRWNFKYFERKEIAWYTWRSTTYQQNFLKV